MSDVCAAGPASFQSAPTQTLWFSPLDVKTPPSPSSRVSPVKAADVHPRAQAVAVLLTERHPFLTHSSTVLPRCHPPSFVPPQCGQPCTHTHSTHPYIHELSRSASRLGCRIVCDAVIALRCTSSSSSFCLSKPVLPAASSIDINRHSCRACTHAPLAPPPPHHHLTSSTDGRTHETRQEGRETTAHLDSHLHPPNSTLHTPTPLTSAT